MTRRLRRKEIWLAERGEFTLERLPAVPDSQVDMLPVIEAGAFHLSLVEREAERLDEMQPRAHGQARAARVPGVPMNLGMDQNDVGLHAFSTRSTLQPS